MIIIELVGLPGCGKSTIIDIARGKRKDLFITRRDLFGIKIPYIWLKQYSIKRRLWNDLRDIYRKTNMMKKKFYFERLIQLILYLTYCSESNPNSVILLEEGIVQYFSSLAYETDLDINLTKVINEQLSTFNPIVIDCKIPVEIACKRINTRKKSGDRYMIDNIAFQHKIMIQKRKNLDYILNLFNGLRFELDMEKNMEELANDLIIIAEKCCEKS